MPPPAELLPELLSDLERFWNRENDPTPPLVRCAIAHYQFETLHPFCDGNGRVGRLLIPLMLIDCGCLHLPTLCISRTLDGNRSEYYRLLSAVHRENRLGDWVLFFLNAVRDCALNDAALMKRLLHFRQENQRYCMSLGRRAETAEQLFACLYATPTFRLSEMAGRLGCESMTLRRLVSRLCGDGFLTGTPGAGHAVVYRFAPYLRLFE